MKKYLLAIVLLSTPAIASDWVQYGKSSDGIKLRIDMASLSREGEYGKAWIELDYVNVPRERARKSVELWKFQCRDKTSITLSQVRYGADGGVMSSHSSPESSYDYVPVAPDTFGEFVLLAACKS